MAQEEPEPLLKKKKKRWTSEEQQFGGITLPELDTFGRMIHQGNGNSGERNFGYSQCRTKSIPVN